MLQKSNCEAARGMVCRALAEDNVLQASVPQVLISIDTFHAKVAAAAVQAGVHIVNDVSGGSLDPDMYSQVFPAGNLPIWLSPDAAVVLSLHVLHGYCPAWEPHGFLGRVILQRQEIIEDLSISSAGCKPVGVGGVQQRSGNGASWLASNC